MLTWHLEENKTLNMIQSQLFYQNKKLTRELQKPDR